MALCLRDDVHWCECEGRAILLDLAADRYFGLPVSASDAFLRLAGARMQRGDAERLGPMVARGLLVETPRDTGIPPPAAVEPPVCDYAATAGMRIRVLDVWSALAAEWRASRLLRRSLKEAIATAATVARSNPADKARSAAPPVVIVAAAQLAALLTRAHDRCLVRGIAVHALCRTRGIPAKLVLGVIAHPFAAHCWVQLGSTVLVGGFEQARLYTPILVIE